MGALNNFTTNKKSLSNWRGFFLTQYIIKWKKVVSNGNDLLIINIINTYLLGRGSSETDSFFLPFLLLALRIFLPFLVDILNLKPCLFFLFLFEGWNVLFILSYLNYTNGVSEIWIAKIYLFSYLQK